MKNQLAKLRKENNAQDKQLSKENSTTMADLICYLRGSDLCEYDLEIIRKELTGMALEAQLRGDVFSDIVGEDKKAFCKELMENGRQKTRYEKVLGSLYTISYALMILYIIELFSTSAILNILEHRQFTMPITFGFIMISVIAIITGYFIYYYFTSNSLEALSRSHKTKTLFIVAFVLLWTAALTLRYVFSKTVLLTVNCLYPLIILVVAYIVIKQLNNHHENSFFR